MPLRGRVGSLAGSPISANRAALHTLNAPANRPPQDPAQPQCLAAGRRGPTKFRGVWAHLLPPKRPVRQVLDAHPRCIGTPPLLEDPCWDPVARGGAVDEHDVPGARGTLPHGLRRLHVDLASAPLCCLCQARRPQMVGVLAWSSQRPRTSNPHDAWTPTLRVGRAPFLPVAIGTRRLPGPDALCQVLAANSIGGRWGRTAFRSGPSLAVEL
mmetsp:Transcript_53193/g.148008  ORF Transcript_53193/g.148008 Transcript_53193/m.148008 type:complete len:212 (-) Transcript_53193:42-677(-)